MRAAAFKLRVPIVMKAACMTTRVSSSGTAGVPAHCLHGAARSGLGLQRGESGGSRLRWFQAMSAVASAPAPLRGAPDPLTMAVSSRLPAVGMVAPALSTMPAAMEALPGPGAPLSAPMAKRLSALETVPAAVAILPPALDSVPVPVAPVVPESGPLPRALDPFEMALDDFPSKMAKHSHFLMRFLTDG